MGGPFIVRKLAIVDTETTGSNFDTARVVQYGVVYVTLPTLEIECVRECYVDPSYDQGFDWGMAVPEAMRVHGLTPEFLRQNGRFPGDALSLMFENVPDWSKTLFSAWGNDFDVGMVKREYEHCGRKPPFKYRTFDVRSAATSLDMALHLEEGLDSEDECAFGFTSVGLMSWIRRMGQHPFVDAMKEQGEFADIERHLGCREAHDALYDALMIVVALRIVQRFNRAGVNFLALAGMVTAVVGKEGL